MTTAYRGDLKLLDFYASRGPDTHPPDDPFTGPGRTRGWGPYPGAHVTQHNPSDLPHAETPLTAPGALPPEELPAYTGGFAVCAKCGKQDAITRYRAAGEHGSRGSGTFRPSPKGERLERECWRCEYTWDEALTDGTDPDTTATESPA